MDSLRELICRQIHRLQKLFPENLAHFGSRDIVIHFSHPFYTHSMCKLSSMIIHNFNAEEIVPFDSKADAKLIIDPNAVLSFPITVQLFQAVGGRDA